MTREDRRSVDLRAGVPYPARLLGLALERAGLGVCGSSIVKLILDAPVGWAERAGGSRNERLIIVTWNPSPEYLQDLLSLEPAGLVAANLVTDDLGKTLCESVERVACGGTYQLMPRSNSPLTDRERAVLRLLARGLSKEAIATRLDLSHSRVVNLATEVHEKLGLRNDREAVLH
jgi:DNA-binding NarL/FixJ family response regulator